MTFDELLNLKDGETWETITDEELLKILSPFFLVTRPDKKVGGGNKANTTSSKTTKGKSMDSLNQELFRLATQAGVLLGGDTKPK